MSFALPQNGEVFVSDVFQRCEGLIDIGIWNGVSKTRFLRWRTNFRSDLERYFAACILDCLIYRSEAQTLALIAHLLQRILPDLAYAQSWKSLVRKDWVRLLSNPRVDPGVRLVAVAKRDHPPLKSSFQILRLMKRHFRVQQQWTVAAWNLGAAGLATDTVVIFIDDFLGTGDQFKQFYGAEDLGKVIPHQPKAYVPLVGYWKGFAAIESAIAGLVVHAVEVLTDQHRLFHTDSECFTDGTNTAQTAEQFYYDLLDARGVPLKGDDRRGYGGLELAYAFQHAAPDNCLPILWWADSPQWIPLFDR